MVKKRNQKKPEKSKGTMKEGRFFKPTFTFDRAFPVLYAACYALIALAIHLSFFPIGDIGVETDFYGDLVVAAQETWKGNFSVANYPYKGPIYSFALVFIHFFGGDWYRNAIVLNILCTAISLIIIYRLLMRVFNRLVACFTMISVSLVLEFFLQAHKASSDMLFFLLCYLAISLVLAEKLSWYRLVCGAFVSALAFLTRYNGIFLPFSTFLVLLIINPGNRPWKRRISVYLVYLAVFIVTCVPWFAANYFETGSMLATRNMENVVAEFYSGANAARLPEGGFSSLGTLFLHDPVYFIKHYLTNIPEHLWLDMRHTLGFFTGFLALLGFLRLLFVPPTRRQWAFLMYPLGLFLAGCVVFHLPRFSIPVIPAYFAIGYSAIFGSGVSARSRLGIAFERAFAKQLHWLKEDLISDQESEISETKNHTDKKPHKRGRNSPDTRVRSVFPRLTPGCIAAVLAIGFINLCQKTPCFQAWG